MAAFFTCKVEGIIFGVFSDTKPLMSNKRDSIEGIYTIYKLIIINTFNVKLLIS